MTTSTTRRRPSLGTALGLVAILIASMGTSYAAGVKITTSSQIKNGIVTGADVKNESLSAKDLSAATVKQLAPTAEAWRVVGAPGQPGFLGTWTAYDVTDYYAPAFRKGADGRVYLRGAASFGSDSASSEDMFVLPAGYRPARCVNFSVSTFDGLGTEDPEGSLEVCNDGTIYTYGAGDERFVSLEGVAFDLR